MLLELAADCARQELRGVHVDVEGGRVSENLRDQPPFHVGAAGDAAGLVWSSKCHDDGAGLARAPVVDVGGLGGQRHVRGQELEAEPALAAPEVDDRPSPPVGISLARGLVRT